MSQNKVHPKNAFEVSFCFWKFGDSVYKGFKNQHSNLKMIVWKRMFPSTMGTSGVFHIRVFAGCIAPSFSIKKGVFGWQRIFFGKWLKLHKTD